MAHIVPLGETICAGLSVPRPLVENPAEPGAGNFENFRGLALVASDPRQYGLHVVPLHVSEGKPRARGRGRRGGRRGKALWTEVGLCEVGPAGEVNGPFDDVP